MSSPVDSSQNRQVAAARALLTRKGRTAATAFLVEGPHAIGEALESAAHRARELFVTPSAAERDADLIIAARAGGTRIHLVTDRVLAGLGETVTPQGMVAVVDTPVADLTATVRTGVRLAVILEGIADPGNAGAVIRTADAAGADVVVASSGSVDVWSGKCVRSSAGSVFHLPVVVDVPVDDAVGAAKAAGCTVLAATVDGSADLDALVDAGTLTAPTAWLLGNEAHGLSAATSSAADHTVRLPIYGRAESLNLAAAAAVCLYASARAQRR